MHTSQCGLMGRECYGLVHCNFTVIQDLCLICKAVNPTLFIAPHFLQVLERRDREHRQRALAGMPANVFQPAQQRAEMVCEQQRDMEEAFEKLFVKTHGT